MVNLANMITVADALQIASGYYQSGGFSDAERVYRYILHQQPDCYPALVNLGATLRVNGQLTAAIACYQKALLLQPEEALIHANLGNALKDAGDQTNAIAHYQQAIALGLKNAEVYHNLGNAYQNDGQLTAAIASYHQSLALAPDQIKTLIALGNALQALGCVWEAIIYYEKVLTLEPNHDEAIWDKAFTTLLAGDLIQGFTEYESRWWVKCAPHPQSFPQPLWDGLPLDGKTILLHTEQGFGDAIQFIRYAPLVAQKGGKVIVQCHQSLVRLFRTIAEIQTVIAIGDPLPDFHFHAPLMSLPHLFGTTLATIPCAIPYLFPAKLSGVKIIAKTRLKIGIAWGGNTSVYRGDRNRYRSCPLQYFSPLFKIPDITWFSLQKGEHRAELTEFADKNRIYDLNEQIKDFADTAAIISQLDLVITVDTSVAHIPGAIGIPVWVILPFCGDWRWLLHREDTPWYSTMQLFRQKQPGDWLEVLTRIAETLKMV